MQISEDNMVLYGAGVFPVEVQRFTNTYRVTIGAILHVLCPQAFCKGQDVRSVLERNILSLWYYLFRRTNRLRGVREEDIPV